MRWKSHVRCGAGENLEITSNSYLSPLPVYCLQAKTTEVIDGAEKSGVWIKKGDKIGQFRVMEVMPTIIFNEKEFFNNADRGGFGTSGTR